MIRTIHIPKCARSHTARQPSLEELFFKMGGFTGAVRRIIRRWHRPFTINQVKVAIVRRHPQLIPPEHQIENIIQVMVERRRLVRLADGSYQRPQLLREAA